jgi:hypothetical protein
VKSIILFGIVSFVGDFLIVICFVFIYNGFFVYLVNIVGRFLLATLSHGIWLTHRAGKCAAWWRNTFQSFRVSEACFLTAVNT